MFILFQHDRQGVEAILNVGQTAVNLQGAGNPVGEVSSQHCPELLGDDLQIRVRGGEAVSSEYGEHQHVDYYRPVTKDWVGQRCKQIPQSAFY